jgi:hypothetical protein
VQRCPREGTWPVKLKDAGDEVAAGRKSGTFISAQVCKPHWDLLMGKTGEYVEWILEIGKDLLNPKWHQETLLLGEELGPLDEFILQQAPVVKERPDLYSRIFSDVAHDGLHVTLEVRRRGSEETETMTVVIPPSMVEGFAQLLRDSQSPGEAST